jgi:hypothetical protein
MKKLLFLGACLVALASQPVMAQVGGADVVVVRVVDTGGRLVIGYPDGKTEEVSFTSNYSSKGLAESAVQLQKAIASLYQKGYSLKSTFSGAGGAVSTLIFVKEK